MDNILTYIYVDISAKKGYLIMFCGVDHTRIELSDIQFSALRSYGVDVISDEAAENYIKLYRKQAAPDLNDLIAAVHDRAKCGQKKELKALFGLFNATRVSELKSRDYKRFYDALLILIP